MIRKIRILPVLVLAGLACLLASGCQRDEQKDELTDGAIGSVTDIDGNFYQTVQLGWGEWMAENLRTTRYNDGSAIQGGLGKSDWSNTLSGAYAVYPYVQIDGLESDAGVVEAYGLHYNWYAVETGILCPEGWRVPSAVDWEGLLYYLIDNYPDIDAGNVGVLLKSCRQVDSPLGGECSTNTHPRWHADGIDHFRKEWESLFPGVDFWDDIPFEPVPLAGTDEFGFAALPAGQYSGQAFGLGYWSRFWTADSDIITVPVSGGEGDFITGTGSAGENVKGNEIMVESEVGLYHDINFGPGTRGFVTKSNGFPVRCVRGELPEREPRFRYNGSTGGP